MILKSTLPIEILNVISSSVDNGVFEGELLTPKGMSFGDTNSSSLFLLLPIIAF